MHIHCHPSFPVLQDTNNIIISQGKTTLFSGHSFLSYNEKQKKWVDIKLNWIQLIIRKVFGFYQNTHLKTVYLSWIKQKNNHINPESDVLKNKITTMCRKYILSNVIAFGNSSLNKAQIICFAEDHTDQKFRKEVMQFILDDQGSKNDTLLIEGCETNEKANDLLKNTYGIQSNTKVKGWEPENYKELMKGVGETHAAKTKQLDDFLHQIIAAVPTNKELHIEDFDKLIQFINSEFTEEYKKLGKYFLVPPHEIIKHIQAINTFLNEMNNKGISHFMKKHANILPSLNEATLDLWNILQKTKKNQNNFSAPNLCVLGFILAHTIPLSMKLTLALYHNMPSIEGKIVKKTSAERTVFLSKQIINQLDSKHRIFAIAGYAHLFHLPSFFWCSSPDKNAITHLHKSLKSYKYVIITSKQLDKTFRPSLFNFKLKRQKLI